MKRVKIGLDSEMPGNSSGYKSLGQHTTTLQNSALDHEDMTLQIEMTEHSPSKIGIQEVDEEIIEFEFSVTGMSCVNCSNNIEKKMRGEYNDKEMQSINIILLVHKMLTRFPLRVFREKAVTP